MLNAPLNMHCKGLPTQHTSLCGLQLPSLPARQRCSSTYAARVTASKQPKDEQQSLPVRLAGPAAAALLASMLLTATVPSEALAARSGGRAGGSSFRSAPRAMPRAAPSPRAAPGYEPMPLFSACLLALARCPCWATCKIYHHLKQSCAWLHGTWTASASCVSCLPFTF